MATKTLNTRVKHKRDTSTNWTSNNPVLLDGEIILVDTANGELRFKVGDGTKAYTQLPFTDEPLRTLIPTATSDLTNDSGFITSSDIPVTSVNSKTGAVSLTHTDVGAASSTHSHGNITSAGDITTTATIASGDRIIINDESASKVTNSSITFGTSTTQYLANNGTWQNIPSDSDTTYSLSMSGNRITLTPSSGTATYVDLPIYDGGVT